MKETAEIIYAYDAACKAGRRTALATVVHVEGSSYRRPGARMLVTEDGGLTGAISGGCLEGDALRKALLAIDQQKNKLVTYDTTDEDDTSFGVQLGCNGIVHILFEPVIATDVNNPVQLLKEVIKERKDVVLTTLFCLNDNTAEQPGTCLLRKEQLTRINKQAVDATFNFLLVDVNDAATEKKSITKEYKVEHKTYIAFYEYIKPAVQIIIAGAGNDVMPMAEISRLLGWDMIVADGRPNQATTARFPQVKKVIVAKPHQLLKQVEIDDQTVFVLMTHNYNYDLALLKELVQQHCSYIGTLGPKKKLERMLNELAAEGIIVNEEQRAKIFGPTGLDIGAETAAEIALSIIAEIKAVLAGKTGQPLKQNKQAIHQRQSQVIKAGELVKEAVSCNI